MLKTSAPIIAPTLAPAATRNGPGSSPFIDCNEHNQKRQTNLSLIASDPVEILNYFQGGGAGARSWTFCLEPELRLNVAAGAGALAVREVAPALGTFLDINGFAN